MESLTFVINKMSLNYLQNQQFCSILRNTKLTCGRSVLDDLTHAVYLTMAFYSYFLIISGCFSKYKNSIHKYINIGAERGHFYLILKGQYDDDI